MTATSCGNVNHLSFKDRRLVAREFQREHPSYSTCSRCFVPWCAVDAKVIDLTENQGAFALCTSCWDDLGDAEHRLPYYVALIPFWERSWFESSCEGDSGKEDEAKLMEQIVAGVYTESAKD